MVERILILLALAAAVLAVWQIARRRSLRLRDESGLRRIGYRPGRPAILYFTAPGCAPCETVQKPALERLADRFQGRLQILEIDASEKPDLADAWGVLAVPTTFVIDRAGRPRRVNHGPAREHVLRAQLAKIDPAGLELKPALEPTVGPGADEGKPHGTLSRPE